jgi:hypothetical protein
MSTDPSIRKMALTAAVAGAAAVAILAAFASAAKAETKAFTQMQDITIYDLDQMEPTPSSLEVAGMRGTITKVVLGLQDLSVNRPPDLDLLLVAPDGKTVVPMSDLGAATAVSDLDIAFDDDAPNPPSQGGLLTSGTYDPSDPFDPDEPTGTVFGAPQPPYGHTMAALAGGSPNGSWRLFGFEDLFNGGGAVGGIDDWSIQITTIEPDVTLTAKKQKLTGKVKLLATSNVDGSLGLTGGVKAKTVELVGGVPTSLKAKLTKKTRKALVAKLENRKTAKAPVSGVFTDASDTTDTAQVKVKVKD